VNVEGTLQVLLAASRVTSVKAVVFASSVAVYSTSSDWHSERERPVPSDIYGLTKLLGEQIVRHYAEQGSFSSICVRLTNIYGPNETNPHILPEILKQVAGGATRLSLGRTDTYRDFLFVEDCAEGLARMLPLFEAAEVHETVNLASGNECSMNDLLDLLFDALGKRLIIEQDPDRVRPVDRAHLRSDISRLQQLLKWKPKTTFREGMASTVARELKTLRAAI
jgi:UDP-glucose 4-epimerase